MPVRLSGRSPVLFAVFAILAGAMPAHAARSTDAGALVAGVAGAGDASAAALGKDWRQVTSPNFTVFGNASEKELRFTVVELERFRQALLTLYPRLKLDSPVPMRVVVFKSDAAFTKFKPRNARGHLVREVGGYYRGSADVNDIVLASQADRRDTYQLIFHEYTHAVVHRNQARLPTWMDEGMAEFFSTFRSDEQGRGILGGVPPLRRDWLRHMELLPLADMLSPEGTSRIFRHPEKVGMFYAQAWALVHYLSLGDRRGQLGKFLDALASGRTQEQAFREVIATTPQKLQDELAMYLMRPKIPGVYVQPSADALRAADAEVRPMREGDVAFLEGDLLMRTGASEPAERALQKALSLDPSHRGARLALSAVRLQQERPAEAVELASAVAGEAPGDFAAHYRFAQALSEAGRHAEAAAAFAKATSLNGDVAWLWFGASTAALAAGDVQASDQALSRVLRMDGSDRWIRLRAAVAFRAGQYEVLVRDLGEFTKARGWSDDESFYAGFLAALGHRRLGDAARADAILAAVAEHAPAKSWTLVVAQFLRGQLNAEAFLARAKSKGERTEAHAYVGLEAATAGRLDEARRHLGWVKAEGARDYVEYDYAVDELRRLERPAP